MEFKIKNKRNLCRILMILGLSLIVSGTANEKRGFDGFKVIRAFPSKPEEFLLLRALQEENLSLDFWTEPGKKGFVDVMAHGQDLENLKDFLAQNQIPYGITIDNLAEIIQEQEVNRVNKLSQMNLQGLKLDFEEYYPLAEIESWLAELSKNNPSLVQVLQIGKSTEGRNVTLVKISNGNNGENKPAFFLTATIHAREWISASTSLYIINELVSNSAAHPDILDKMDFYVLPVINVDGYVFSHVSDRMWRKTRSDRDSPLNCIGVDANRNFDFKWGQAPGGSSSNKCSETYRGPEGFSEPEVAAIRDYVENNPQINWGVYVTLHSYGQYFMSPWGYTDDLPQNYETMKKISDDAAAALASEYGTIYETGSSANVLYYTDGTDQDWAFGSGHFSYSYTMELRDQGRYGFVLPPSQIIPTGQETFEAIKVVARNVNL